jgi:predicted RNase H-like HicB family nuclease
MEQVQNYLRRPYARIVVPMESKGYHAEILEFSGCFAQGETVEKAYNNLEKAAHSWIETTLSQGHAIPEPSANLNYSGRIALRLPISVHEHAAHLAERDETSLNTYLVSAISARVGAEEFYNVLAQRLMNQCFTTTASTVNQIWSGNLIQQNINVQIDVGTDRTPLQAATLARPRR